MPAVNNVGEPCAGEPHARFDGRGLETGHITCHRASPRPSMAGLREWVLNSRKISSVRHEVLCERRWIRANGISIRAGWDAGPGLM
jgi:hypothetical protein